MTLHIPELPDGIDIMGAALRYAAAGWFVLPIRLDGGGKHPGSVLGKGWQHKSSRNADVIASWFAGTSYGLALHVGRSGAVAFDVDDPFAAPAVLVEAVRATGAPYQSTRLEDTGRGHYLFSAEPGSVGNSAAGLGKGWGEVRGLNGIVVVAPTPHGKADQGGLYRWARGGALPVMPLELAAATRPPQGGADPADWGELREWLEALPAGEPFAAVAAVDITMPPAGRYDRMRDASMELVGYGVRGYAGVRERLAALGQAYITAAGPDRAGGDRTAHSEFIRAVAGALHNVDDVPPPDVAFDPGAEVLAAWEVARAGDPFVGPAAIDGLGEPVEMDPVGALRARLLTPAQLVERPPASPLVGGLLYRDTLAWLIGKSGTFKSFIALDIAAHVAAGEAWAGRRVWGGPVVYMAAEGAGGMSLRVRAWAEKHGPMSDALMMLPGAVQVNGEHWPTFVALCVQLAPALIVVDTQARVSVGVRENDNGEMGAMIDRLDLLRKATGACVLLVHHIGRQGTDARGASAIDAAQDTELRVERIGGPKSMRAELVVDKQKDGPDTDAIRLALETIELGPDPTTGEPLTSLVVMPDLFIDPFPVAPWREVKNENQALIMQILGEQFSERGGTRAEVAAVLRELGQRGEAKYRRATFYDAWNALMKKDLLEQVPGTQRFVLADPQGPAGSTDVSPDGPK